MIPENEYVNGNNDVMVKRFFCKTLEDLLIVESLTELAELYSLEELNDLVDKKKKELEG